MIITGTYVPVCMSPFLKVPSVITISLHLLCLYANMVNHVDTMYVKTNHAIFNLRKFLEVKYVSST